MAAADPLDQILFELASDDDIAGCAVISNDGLLLACALQPGAEDAVGEDTAALVDQAAQVIGGFGLGRMREISLQGDLGCAVFVPADATAMLLLVLRPGATGEVTRLHARRALGALAPLSPLYP